MKGLLYKSLLAFGVGSLLWEPLNASQGSISQNLLSKSQVVFAENEGQYDSYILYASYPTNLYITKEGLRIGKTVIRFLGANIQAHKRQNIAQARFNYFIGKDPDKWMKDIKSYHRILLEDVYPNIDLVLTGLDDGRVEFQWFVKPGGDVSSIRLKVENGDIISDGDVIRVVSEGKTLFKIENLMAFQGSKEVKVGTHVKDGIISYSVDDYDPNHTLVIDPDLAILSGSTFIGGGTDDYAFAVALDATGNVYITGYTLSDNFPMNGWDNTRNGRADAFIAKFSPDLSTLIAATYIGGGKEDYAYDIAIDDAGNVFITGYTKSDNFPTSGSAYQVDRQGGFDAFISKFNSDLSNLLASTYIGGNEDDWAYAIYVDPVGNVFIGGRTFSLDYPVSGYDNTYDNRYFAEGFVSKLDNNLTTLLGSTFLGGNYDDVVYDLIVDAAGNVYATGGTQSVDFPTTAGSYDQSHNGGYDAFVSKLDNDLNTLLASTFIGGDLGDIAYGIALDPSGNVYITGIDSSLVFPTTPGAYGRDYFGGPTDAFVSRFDANLSALLQSTTIGGSGEDYAYSIAVEPTTGKVFITGYTSSPDYPTTPFAYDYWFNDTYPVADVFVSEFNPTLTDLYASTFVGGSYGDYARDIAIKGTNVYVVGYTFSNNYPTVSGSYSTVPFGGVDAFISNLDPEVPTDVSSRVPESNRFSISHDYIMVHVYTPSYVGVDVYSENGSLVKRVSLGFLYKGEYKIRLSDLARGSYIVKMRIGSKVYVHKLII